MENGTDLQFDRAQFDNSVPQRVCSGCARPLVASYFSINGNAVCEACCDRVRNQGAGGSPVSRVLKAIGAGAGAALGGAILYYAILALTGYEFGLIAIVVGVAVGRAVRWGSSGRGGWAYQTIAVVLTYLSIVSAYVPVIVGEVAKQSKEEASASTTRSATPADSAAPVQASARTTTPPPPPSLGGFGLALVMFALLIIAIPFLGGFSNIIGLVIIGIGLYEAWKVNRRVPLDITGPHSLASSSPAGG
jgi:hypothetical protein